MRMKRRRRKRHIHSLFSRIQGERITQKEERKKDEREEKEERRSDKSCSSFSSSSDSKLFTSNISTFSIVLGHPFLIIVISTQNLKNR